LDDRDSKINRYKELEHSKEGSNLLHENFRLLKDIAPGILSERYSYMKLKASGFMDLILESIGKDCLSMGHYYEQNGDLMADPDMEIFIDKDKESLAAATFQQDNLAIYQNAYSGGELIDGNLANELNSFLKEWLTNISNQGHKVYMAQYSDHIITYQEVPIFDAYGNEVLEQNLDEEEMDI